MKAGAKDFEQPGQDEARRLSSLEELEAEVAACRACPRLVQWREQVAAEKRRSFADDEYWGRGVPGFGDPNARLLILGLAPAAHGANRTGRVFTGDRSGDWLYAALYRAGFSTTPQSVSRTDGLKLPDAYVTASVKCAPPQNKPLPEERANCERFLDAEMDLLDRVEVIVCLGAFAWDNALRLLGRRGAVVPRPKPRFGHLETARVGHVILIGSYHPSQQNTFTGVLTEPMFDAVFALARQYLEADPAVR